MVCHIFWFAVIKGEGRAGSRQNYTMRSHTFTDRRGSAAGGQGRAPGACGESLVGLEGVGAFKVVCIKVASFLAGLARINPLPE